MNLKKIILIVTIGLCGLFSGTVSAQVRNPILPGFYPDPSICRVDSDYYLVNSSFSFYPGVPIFHSRDLVHWKQIGNVLNRPSQLNLTNQRISGGIYAPAIRYNNGIFYMVTTFVNGIGNFFVTATNPAGPWSDPVLLSGIGGIDPSFFFDENGKAYIVNNDNAPDNKPLYNGHCTIRLQEFDLETQKLIGERKIIVNGGTDLAKKPIWIEGPHLFKKDGYYFLMAAQGGTEINHSEVIFRSKSVWGPYESFSGNPILTQRDLPADRPNPITCSGHADMVQTQNGDWVAVFLACQPYSENYFNTGRQTFFNKVDWSGEWPIILEKGKVIPAEVKSPLKAASGEITFADYSAYWRDDFDGQELKLEWNFIRTPKEKWYELKDNHLLMQARNVSITEKGNPSFIGRRLQHSYAEIITAVKLEKGKDMEAGWVAFQNEENQYKFVVECLKGKIYLVESTPSKTDIVAWSYNELTEYNSTDFIFLKIKIEGKQFECFYSLNNKDWTSAAGKKDATKLTTQVAGGFVGAYLGLYSYAKEPAIATFDWVTYQKNEQAN
ncbi:MAG TPA: glycoside hydrolase family 43 protein [Prolixibacteraceae bacterium]|nr:glycoside hydrolase family 43 protein [Prolixibacteraceae bacterium]